MHTIEFSMPDKPDPKAPAGTPTEDRPVLHRFEETPEGFRWREIELLQYKPEGTHFKGITRQALFNRPDEIPAALRYFEIEPGGYSSFEKHRHVHAVMILQGRGRVLVGDSVYDVAPFDLVYIPSGKWHQFRADDDAPLGFLCLVASDRDRPECPGEEDLAVIRSIPGLDAFVRL